MMPLSSRVWGRFLSGMVIKFPLLRGPVPLNLEINDTNIDDFNGFNYPEWTMRFSEHFVGLFLLSSKIIVVTVKVAK